jgi:hypothetical protein
LTQAETDFYRGHLMMLRGFLSKEQEQTRALLDEIKMAA